MSETIVSGKRVVFKKHMAIKEYPHLIGDYRKMNANEPQTAIPVAMQMIESWDFPGDPATAESYESMDALQYWALFRAINDEWYSRVAAPPAQPKEA